MSMAVLNRSSSVSTALPLRPTSSGGPAPLAVASEQTVQHAPFRHSPPVRIGWWLISLGVGWLGILYLTAVVFVQDSPIEPLPLANIYDSGMMDVLEQRLTMEEE